MKGGKSIKCYNVIFVILVIGVYMRLAVKKKVVISCVTFETVRIVKPIQYIQDVRRVYLLHWVGLSDTKKQKLYGSFYNEIVRQLNDLGIKDIIEVQVKVYRFQDVLRELLKVLCTEHDEGNEVYVNVSGGSSEYGAAATIASMMVPDVTTITVGTKEYMVQGEKNIKNTYFEGERPIGLSKDVWEPRLLPTFNIGIPPEDLVISLRILRHKKENQQLTTYSKMIDSIKNANIWTRDERKKVIDLVQAERMYYAHHYIEQWIERGWAVRDKRGELTITESGEMITEVFYSDVSIQ